MLKFHEYFSHVKIKIIGVMLTISAFCEKPIFSQTTSWEHNNIERRLDNLNSQLDEINNREKKKESETAYAQQMAFEERLLSVPLDDDLVQMLQKNAEEAERSGLGIMQRAGMARRFRIELAQAQLRRNELAKTQSQNNRSTQNLNKADSSSTNISKLTIQEISGAWQLPDGKIFSGKVFKILNNGTIVLNSGQKIPDAIKIDSSGNESRITISVYETNQGPSYTGVFYWDSENKLLVHNGTRLKKLLNAKPQ